MITVFKGLGPYEIRKEIGRGGMAVVFLAVDTRTGRELALKLVPQGTDREAREILHAEMCGAELQRQFSQVSTHVPAVYEHGADESGYFYVAMEYLDGENLSEVITRGPLAVERAVNIAIELCRFLEQAHRFEAIVDGRSLRSLLHLDLKPRNVRITSSEQVKVLDFGIAKALSLSRKVTRNDFGSVAYLSPERLETGEVDAYADFWGIGVLLHEMLSGAPPFQSPDTRRLERQILSRRPPPPLPAETPAGIQAIAAKLLGPYPADRYGTASEIREDLERFKAGARTVAEEEGWPAKAADDQATRRTRQPAAQPEDEPEDEKTRRTRPDTVPTQNRTPPDAAPAAPEATSTPVAKPPQVLKKKKGKVRRLLRTALLIVAIGLVMNELDVGSDAGRLADAVPTQELNQLPEAWRVYDGLEERSQLGLGTMGLERALIERTIVVSDRVIANYRAPAPTVREAQWRMARDILARAVARAPRDRRLRASLRYCDGHLHRINGEAQKIRKETSQAHRELTEALADFREAAELRPGWPDPFLGLARTFIYGLEDVDRASDALSQAQKNGYTPSEREMAQLADGYRTRGNTLVRSARQLSGMPQEREYLTRAAEAYRKALDLYAKASSFSHVPSNIRITQRALTRVEDKLAELSGTGGDLDVIDSGAVRSIPFSGLPVPGIAPWA